MKQIKYSNHNHHKFGRTNLNQADQEDDTLNINNVELQNNINDILREDQNINNYATLLANHILKSTDDDHENKNFHGPDPIP